MMRSFISVGTGRPSRSKKRPMTSPTAPLARSSSICRLVMKPARTTVASDAALPIPIMARWAERATSKAEWMLRSRMSTSRTSRDSTTQGT